MTQQWNGLVLEVLLWLLKSLLLGPQEMWKAGWAQSLSSLSIHTKLKWPLKSWSCLADGALRVKQRDAGSKTDQPSGWPFKLCRLEPAELSWQQTLPSQPLFVTLCGHMQKSKTTKKASAVILEALVENKPSTKLKALADARLCWPLVPCLKQAHKSL